MPHAGSNSLSFEVEVLFPQTTLANVRGDWLLKNDPKANDECMSREARCWNMSAIFNCNDAPGSGDDPVKSRKALFLDRDGIVNLDHGYVHTQKHFEWMPGIFNLAKLFSDAGFKIIIVTNQSGIARSYYSKDEFETLSRWMISRFAEEGVPDVSVFYCHHHPRFGERIDCEWRKPKPGMITSALKRYGLLAKECFLIGDRKSDMEAGRVAGIEQLYGVGDAGDFLTPYEIYEEFVRKGVPCNSGD